jgi:hypothetical protein
MAVSNLGKSRSRMSSDETYQWGAFLLSRVQQIPSWERRGHTCAEDGAFGSQCDSVLVRVTLHFSGYPG